MSLFKVLASLCVMFAAAHGTSVIVGQVYDPQGLVTKVYEKTAEKTAIPLYVRDEELQFAYPNPGQKIKGIAIKDLDNGMAKPSIVRGGLGFDYVHIKLKSERGSGYRFLIEIFA